MSGNSNPSINSPASSNHDLDTLVGDDAIIAANLLQEFNDRQARHISVSSTDSSSVQYVPHSPTPSIQELSSPPPLRVHLTTEGVGHYPPISPGSAATLLRMEDNSLTDTTRAPTCQPPSSATEDEWTSKCPPTAGRTSSQGGSASWGTARSSPEPARG